MVHAVDHFAPDGILIVEEARIFEADEELAVGAVRILRARHRTDAADMRFGAEFGGQVGKLAAPHAGAGRIAALRHEAVDHAVENHVVRSEEHTSELQSLMRISYAVFCLKKKKKNTHTKTQIMEERQK